MKLVKLSNNAHILYMNSAIFLFSYELCIGMYEDTQDLLYLRKDYNTYSNTTTKHVYSFIQRFLNSDIHSQKDIEEEKRIIFVDTF